MSDHLYISASCIISDRSVTKNGEMLFSADDTDLSAFLLAIYQHFNYSYAKFYKMDKLSKLGWLAAEVLLGEPNKAIGNDAYQTGVVLANANASLEADLNYLQTIDDVPSPALFVYTLPNIVIGEICIRHGFKGENLFFIQPQFDAAFVNQQVSYLINQHKLKACVCGWVDVIGNEYKAALYRVSADAGANAPVFNADEMLKIYKANG